MHRNRREAITTPHANMGTPPTHLDAAMLAKYAKKGASGHTILLSQDSCVYCSRHLHGARFRTTAAARVVKRTYQNPSARRQTCSNRVPRESGTKLEQEALHLVDDRPLEVRLAVR